MNQAIIQIGEVFASREPTVVQTLLGSCIAACLFDPVSLVGGMNHFMLPDGPESDPLPTRYGKQAMAELIQRIERLGGRKHRLEAKIFGAASLLDMKETWLCVACANDRFVRGFLAAEGIAVVGEQLRGKLPLKVRMETATGVVHVRALPRSINRLAPKEREYRDTAFATRWQWYKGCDKFPKLSA